MMDQGAIEGGIGYRFKNRMHLEQALTHKTFAEEAQDHHIEDNQRLAFLGDAVIELAVRRHIFDAGIPIAHEGASELADKAVRNSALARVATQLDLPRHLRFGKGEKPDKLRENQDLHADALEAVFAAVCLDSDAEMACRRAIAVFRTHAPDLLRPETR